MGTDYYERAFAWSKVLFKPPLPQLDAALSAPELETRPPANLSEGARRAWFDQMAVRLGQEQWEAMSARGLIPPEWIEDKSRAFLGLKAVHNPTRGASSTSYQLDKFSHPASINAAVAIAANPSGILSAEEFLREHLRRARYFSFWDHNRPGVLWDFGVKASAPSYWTLPEMLFDNFVRTSAEYEMRSELERRVPVWLREEKGVLGWLGLWASHAVLIEFLSEQWQRSVAANERVKKGAQGSEGKRYAEFLDPCEPLLEILRLGYAHAGEHNTFRLPVLCGLFP